jgi:hypothetical protein
MSSGFDSIQNGRQHGRAWALPRLHNRNASVHGIKRPLLDRRDSLSPQSNAKKYVNLNGVISDLRVFELRSMPSEKAVSGN